VRLPGGFLASSVRAGVRKDRPDLALLLAEKGANAAAVFTKNRFQAAPVVLARNGLRKSGGRVRAVVVNSGCANAATGSAGLSAARRVRNRAAELVGCPPEEVFAASTGVIGVVLPDAKIRAALPGALHRASKSGLAAASRAILTTDVGPKVAEASFRVGGRTGRIVGIAKGAGMIHPNMATMLAFVMTDAAATPAFLRRALRDSVDASFNAISVDGDASTNDSLLLLANGAAGNAAVRPGSRDAARFAAVLADALGELARLCVLDGEGASRCVEVVVRGAASDEDARRMARAIGNSTLCKCAFAGGDPNWGRFVCAAGAAGPPLDPDRVDVVVDGVVVARRGRPIPAALPRAARRMARREFRIVLDLHLGRGAGRMLASDLTVEYVHFNAAYTT